MISVLTIEPDEEVERIQARLARVRGRQVYLYLPKPNTALRHRLSLTRLRRTADELGLNLIIVTHDSATRVMAGIVGLRVAWRLDGEWIMENGEWRTEITQVPLHLQPPISNLQSLISTPVLAAVLLAFGLTLALLILPQATIVITPLTAPLETTAEMLADPSLTTVDVSGHRVPARRLEVSLDRQAREPPSARTDIPDQPARGTVVFVNQSERDVVIPAGSLVSTSGGTRVMFRTQEAVTVPRPAGTTVRARVEAVQPGLEGNVPAYTITVLNPGLGLPVAVVNDRPMRGGTVRRVGFVTQDELDRVRDALFDRTRREAVEALRAQVGEDEALIDESIEVQIVKESFSEQAEAVADVITVDLTVRVVGTAVNFDQARQLAGKVLRGQVPAGHAVVADSLKTEIRPVLGVESGLVWLQVRATATSQAQIRERDLKNAVRGRPIDEAAILLQERFPLASPPIIHVARGWLGRLPWLSMRISVEVAGFQPAQAGFAKIAATSSRQGSR